MAINSTPRAFNTQATQGRPRDSNIYIGFVKRNDDAQRMGRIGVYIPELGGDPQNVESWITASYCAPFAGATDPQQINSGSQEMGGSQQSYGFWMIPPDINNEVAVFFANGDSGRAFWFGCIYQQNMNHMVPGIASNIPTDPAWKDNTGTLPPVTEYNKKNVGSTENPARPIFRPLLDGLEYQGLVRDFERGVSSTSARREAPSAVFGWLTPRGNTVHVDDNPVNEFIRMRTRSGAQVLIHETTGYVYINSKNGGAWVEIADSGVAIYSQNSISIRAEKDLNFHADKNITMEAGLGIYMSAGQDATLSTGRDCNIGVGNNLVLSTTGSAALTVGSDGALKVGGALALDGAGNITMKSGGSIIRSAPSIQDNSAAAPSVDAAPATLPVAVPVANQSAVNGTQTKGLVNSICPILPTHEPWAGHARRDIPLPDGQNQAVQPGYPLTQTATGDLSNGISATSLKVLVPTGDGTQRAVGNPSEQSCPVSTGGKSTTTITNTQYQALISAAKVSGIDQSTALAIGDIESGGYNRAFYLAATHDAKGMMQIQSATFQGLVKQYGQTDGVGYGDVLDDTASAKMGVRYMAQMRDILIKRGVASPSGGDIYGMYNAGPGGYAQICAANPSALGKDILPSTAQSNPKFYFKNGVPLSCADVRKAYDLEVNTRAAKYANLYGLSTPCDAVNKTQDNGDTAATVSGASVGANGSYVANLQQANALKGTVVTTGQCVAFVQKVSGAPLTANWTQGISVKGNTSIPAGTAIALFGTNGKYTNSLSGTAHAAIYLGQDGSGIQVLDQWTGQAVHERTIYFSHTSGSLVNNGNVYHVISKAGSGTTGV